MNNENNNDPNGDGEISTRNYRGPDRRKPGYDIRDPELSKLVRTDHRGYRILELRSNVHRRRADDRTVDPLEILNIDLLQLEAD